ncbi:MAG: MmcB family DNA repair protein, partial [Pseudomonadota bacterium]
SVNSRPPLKDGRQSDRALSIRRGLQRMFYEMKHATLPEMTLDNGRRADLVCLCPKGRITIVEIKSSVQDFRSDNKWPDYSAFCDAFLFATLPDLPEDLFPETEGLIIADRFGAEIVREPRENGLSAARRKKLVQVFATTAAERLMQAEIASEALAALPKT